MREKDFIREQKEKNSELIRRLAKEKGITEKEMRRLLKKGVW